MSIRIAIVDDHPMVTDGLDAALRTINALAVECDQSADAKVSPAYSASAPIATSVRVPKPSNGWRVCMSRTIRICVSTNAPMAGVAGK